MKNDLQTVVSRRCDELPTAAWDAMCGQRQPFAQVKWLRLLEAILLDYAPVYVQVWQGDRLIAGLVCHTQRHFHLSAHLSSPLLAWGATRLLHLISPLSCLLPLYAYPGVIVAEGVETAVVLPHLSPILARVQKAERSQLLSINPVSLETQPNLSAWPGFATTNIVSDAVLDIAWDSYDEYQMWLPGKKRAEIRRVRNRAADAGVQVETRPLAATDGARIESLMQMVMDHHDSGYMFQPGVVAKTAVYLDESDYRHMVALHQGDIIGTLTLFQSEGVALVRWAGLAYERTRDTYAYHLLMSETVKLAIEMGARQLKLGGTVFTLKKQLGARLEERRALLRLRNPLLHAAMGQALDWQHRRAAGSANEPSAK